MSGWVNALRGSVGLPLSDSIPPTACQGSVWASSAHPLQLGSLMGPTFPLLACCLSIIFSHPNPPVSCVLPTHPLLCFIFFCWSVFSPSLFSFVAFWRCFTLPQWVIFHPVRMNKAHPMHKNLLFSRPVSVQLWAGPSFSASLRMLWVCVLLQQQISLHILCCQPCVSL